jgi:hypothetical protein
LEIYILSKDEEVQDTLKCFFNQFGFIDFYTQIVLEEFFKELLNDKSDVCLFSEERQKGHKNNK